MKDTKAMDTMSFRAARMLLVAIFVFIIAGSALNILALLFADRAEAQTLSDVRAKFATRIVEPYQDGTPIAEPPSEIFQQVEYPSAVGPLGAYLSKYTESAILLPAIIWIAGGDTNTIGDMWSAQPRGNDQTAAAFRKLGIVLMVPSLRGGNENPGSQEGFYGEVDDILAARAFLAARKGIDPKRIYLGGHSTGGTLVLLTAEVSDAFRAVFSFGPVTDPRVYTGQPVPFDPKNPLEFAVRAPIHWLDGVKTPTLIIEGTIGTSNISSLREMAKRTTNSALRFFAVPGVDHFGVLAPVSELIAAKILNDRDGVSRIAITDSELAAAVKR